MRLVLYLELNLDSVVFSYDWEKADIVYGLCVKWKVII